MRLTQGSEKRKAIIIHYIVYHKMFEPAYFNVCVLQVAYFVILRCKVKQQQQQQQQKQTHQ